MSTRLEVLALGLGWARPAAAWALLLPPVLLLLLRLLREPPSVAIGTLALWESLPRALQGRGARLRRLPTARALLAALALFLGALAWLGPRSSARSART